MHSQLFLLVIRRQKRYHGEKQTERENHYMKHARKWLACLLAGVLALAVLAGCSALMDGTVQKDTEQAKA